MAFDGVDWLTVAEGFGVTDESLVHRAVRPVTVRSAFGTTGAWFEVKYGYRGRPLVIYRWQGARAEAEALEALQHLADRMHLPETRLLEATLSQTVEVVAVELPIKPATDMSTVVAGQAAEFFADLGSGTICDPAEEWWSIVNGVPSLVLGAR